MLDVSLRMNENRNPDELVDFILDEVVELCGAERAALALLDGDNDLRWFTRGVDEGELPEVQALAEEHAGGDAHRPASGPDGE
jgi:hypothetical protein